MSSITVHGSDSYQHTQAVAATTWTIEHNLRRYPIVDVYTTISGSLVKIMPSSITHTSSTVCTVTFSTPFSGFAAVA